MNNKEMNKKINYSPEFCELITMWEKMFTTLTRSPGVATATQIDTERSEEPIRMYAEKRNTKLTMNKIL